MNSLRPLDRGGITTSQAFARGDFEVAPITRNVAMAYLAANHRHLRRHLAGWLFGVQLLQRGEIVGVGCASRLARMLQDGRTIVISRVCTNGQPNACSAIYGALRRAAVALGYLRVVTYTVAGEEPETSLRAAGFREDGVTSGGEWDRSSRRRSPAEIAAPKTRWVWTVRDRRRAEGMEQLGIGGIGS